MKGSQRGHSDLPGPCWPCDVLLGHGHTAVPLVAKPWRWVPCLRPQGRCRSSLIRSSPLPCAPWPERAACPGCPPGRVWQEARGCQRQAGGWQTAARPLSAPGPSCAARPRWQCGCFGSRRWAGRRGPWGPERSTSTAGSLGRKETRQRHCWGRDGPTGRESSWGWFSDLDGVTHTCGSHCVVPSPQWST